jgi:hypothetical protein
MNQIEKKINSQLNWKLIITNFVGFIFILSCLLLLRVPLLINADYMLSFDEAYQGSQILDLMNGGPIHFYYEGESYAGIFLGLAAIPFFGLFGVSAIAYKVPAIISYALYILSSYWIAKKINSLAALTVVFLMIFSPTSVLSISTSNWPHNLIVFFGNVIILLFIQYKESENPKAGILFLLGAFIGFSIYSYTYSILYIASIAVIFILTHERWSWLRSLISFPKIISIWKGGKSTKIKFIRFLDFVIICFFGAILFSYIFGGFGIDIAGLSIFQINNLHKPVVQVLIIMVVRGLLYREDINLKLAIQKIKTILDSIIPIRLFVIGGLGFVVGILPRLASILIGETTRGGQGFDVDFNPIKIIDHFIQLVIFYIPEFFDVRAPLVTFSAKDLSLLNFFRIGFAVAISYLIIKSIYFFYSERSVEVKNIIRLKSQKFNPGLILVVFPLLVCSANVLTQNGALMRYILPLHGVVAIWMAIYLDRVRLQSKMVFAGILFFWSGFSLLNANTYYSEIKPNLKSSMVKVIGKLSIPKYENQFIKLVKYCNAKDISNVYTDYSTAAQINFFGYGKVIAGVYDKAKGSRRKNHVLSMENKFSLIISKDNIKHLNLYEKYLEESSLQFSQKLVNEEFWFLTDFKGRSDEINSLRNLIPSNF